jgi:hypothetical protein
LRSVQMVQSTRRLMIKYAVARARVGVECTARMATRLGEDAIAFTMFPSVEVTARPAGRDRLARESTRSDADPAELDDASFRAVRRMG